MRDLGRLLRPQSIAVMGGGWSANVLRSLKKAGYQGEIYALHPKKDEVEGVRAYRDLSDLPRPPDAVFIGVNRDATIDTVRRLAAMGGGGAVCFASGWSEVADGAERQQALVEAAGEMPILGPNCYGFINYLDGAMLWPDVQGGVPVDRGVAIIAQSSNVAINLTMQQRALPIAYLMTVGNQAQTTVADVIESLLDDPRVTAIGLHLEGFGDFKRLESALLRARAQGVPVVAIKVGTSDAAQAMTMSHTATLAGPDNLSTAFLARCGTARVRSMEEMLETLKILHVLGPSPDNTASSMSCSGGEASLVADMAEEKGLNLRPLTEAEAAVLGATTAPMVTVSNPLDYHTFDWGNEPRMQATYAAMLKAPMGLHMLIMDMPRTDRCDASAWDPAVRAIIAAQKETGARLAVVSTLSESMPESFAQMLMDHGIVPLNGLETAIAAAAHAARLGQPLPAHEPLAANPPVIGVEAQVLHEAEGKQMLAEFGLSTPPGRFCPDTEATVAAAEALGYPVVVKAISRAMPHKTEFGAVKLFLRDADAVRAACDSMAHLNAPYLVERMVEGAVTEMILGIARDSNFGLYLTIGAGGILVELLKDSAVMLLPVTREEVATALDGLKIAPLLRGYRGKPGADREAIIDCVMAVAAFAQAHADRLEELDINPLMVTPQGAFAADALIRMRLED